MQENKEPVFQNDKDGDDEKLSMIILFNNVSNYINNIHVLAIYLMYLFIFLFICLFQLTNYDFFFLCLHTPSCYGVFHGKLIHMEERRFTRPPTPRLMFHASLLGEHRLQHLISNCLHILFPFLFCLYNFSIMTSKGLNLINFPSNY